MASKTKKWYVSKGKYEKYLEINRKIKERYRNRTNSKRWHRRKWSDEEIELILLHDIPDRELSEILKRSVTAIQVKRAKLKNNIY